MQNKTKNPKTGGKGEQQGTLDGAFGKITGPQGFTRDGVLHTVAQFVACNDQVRCAECCRRRALIVGAVPSSGRQAIVPQLFSCYETEIDTKRFADHSRCKKIHSQSFC